MIYLRKERNLKYTDKNCKKYLRIDFCKTCAYCLLREGDVGGVDNFQIDHFRPSSKGGSDDYDNLYYSCISCNGRGGKSNNFSITMLDPCKDDIWEAHINLLGSFKCNALTERGAEFINLLRLDRVKYVNRRKKLHKIRTRLQGKLDYLKTSLETISLDAKNKNIMDYLRNEIKELTSKILYGNNYEFSEN